MRPGHLSSAWKGLTVVLLLCGCADAVRMGTSVAQQAGVITAEEKSRYDRAAVETEKAARPMTDSEEYYLGRAVAANIFSQYGLYREERLTRYVNQVGQTLALSSDRPLTYQGYHFAILDTREINAFACPGGIILVTRGMIDLTQSEEELAAILAHEIAHVNHKDGVAAIEKSRWTKVAVIMGAQAARELTSGQFNDLVNLFEDSVGDVVKTLVVNGYSRQQELDADAGALVFMERLGYDPRGLTDLLSCLAKEQTASPDKGFFSTHPGTEERMKTAQSFIDVYHWQKVDHRIRDQRFSSMRPQR